MLEVAVAPIYSLAAVKNMADQLAVQNDFELTFPQYFDLLSSACIQLDRKRGIQHRAQRHNTHNVYHWQNFGYLVV